MGEGKPFRFGVTTSSAGSRREWAEKARTLEALGYSTMTVPDHFPDRLATVPALMSAAVAPNTASPTSSSTQASRNTSSSLLRWWRCWRASERYSVMDFYSIIEVMHDTISIEPNHAELFDVASGQRGYFTTQQARDLGFSGSLLAHHVRSGRFIRIYHGVYRFRDYPSSPREEVMAAWLAVGQDVAVVSHESALDLLELSDVIPTAVHLTVPRKKRYISSSPGTVIHTTMRDLPPEDLTVRDGIRLTTATRTILDVAEAGTAPEQVELAIRQAIHQGLTTAERLHQAEKNRNQRVRQLVADVLVGIGS